MRGRRRVLELGRDHGALGGQALQRRLVVERGDDVLVGDLARRRVRVGLEHHGAVAHRPRRHRRSTGRAGHRRESPSVAGGVIMAAEACAAAASSWRLPRGRRRARSPVRRRRRASSATANSAAFVAPASPMANVATGTPAGICTIEYSESCPPRWRRATGTPSTGTVVFAASIPGKCAAPPAPAMIARSPRPLADSAKANISSGMRWADNTCTSWATPNCSSTSTALLIVGQSLVDPITTATSGFSFTGSVCASECLALPVRAWLSTGPRPRARLRSRPRGRGAVRRNRRPARR